MFDKPSQPPTIPEPPWWDTPVHGQPRTRLTRTAIVVAATEVLDEQGLEGLTMRRVADRLHTGPASLYWHVANKEQLIDLILDRAIAEIELPQPDPTRWKEQLRSFAYSSRDMFQRHSNLGLASLGRIPFGPNLVQMAEWLLSLLRGAGVPDRAASWFADLLALVGAAIAAEDHMRASQGDEALEAIGEYIASLPAERFPNLIEVAGAMISGTSDDRFEFAVELLLEGISSFIEREQ